MRLEFEPTIKERIEYAVAEAFSENKIVKKIVLTAYEWEEYKSYLVTAHEKLQPNIFWYCGNAIPIEVEGYLL